MKIKITRDTLSQSYFDALRIRNQVFVQEQGVPYNLEVANASEEAQAVHFVLYDEQGQAVATVRLLPDLEEHCGLIQRMAVLPNQRGQGYAKLLIEKLIETAQHSAITKLTLHAQLPARGFYSKFNFTSVGEIFEEAGIQHITMQRFL